MDNPELRGLETIVEKEKHERTAQHYPNVSFVVKYDVDRVDLRRASAQARWRTHDEISFDLFLSLLDFRERVRKAREIREGLQSH